MGRNPRGASLYAFWGGLITDEIDRRLEAAGGRVVVDTESLTFLSGSELGFSDALTDSGFKITNPNAARSCGCGTSFEPSEEGTTPSYDPSLDGSVCGDEESQESPATAN